MSSSLPPKKRPLRLRPDNFTPRTRTPWGGARITETYKRGLAPAQVVGESWEFSVEPDFPSQTESDGPLPALIAADPDGLVGRGHDSTALLVKLLDAAAPLSVQIHPSDRDPALAEDESGKPETWYVLDADEDAALYLGFLPGVTEAEVRGCIEAGGALDALLQRVVVEPGDFFVIEAGTPHAVGAGLTLVEPQRVLPGKRGLTYRYWDWNRRYDDQGVQHPSGAPRTLHLERALAVTDWSGASSALDTARTHRGVPDTAGAPSRVALSGAFPWVAVERLAGTGALSLDLPDHLHALTVVGGSLRLEGPDFDVRARMGETVALPAALPGLRVHLEGALALLCSTEGA